MSVSPLKNKLFLIDRNLSPSEAELSLIKDIIDETISEKIESVKKIDYFSFFYDSFMVDTPKGSYVVKICFDENSSVLDNEYSALKFFSSRASRMFYDPSPIFISSRNGVKFTLNRFPRSFIRVSDLSMEEYKEVLVQFCPSVFGELTLYSDDIKVLSLRDYTSLAIPDIFSILPDFTLDSLKKESSYDILSSFYSASKQLVVDSFMEEWDHERSISVFDIRKDSIVVDKDGGTIFFLDLSSLCRCSPTVPLITSFLRLGIPVKQIPGIQQMDKKNVGFCIGYVFCSLVVEYVLGGYLSPEVNRGSILDVMDSISRNSSLIYAVFPFFRDKSKEFYEAFNKPTY
jgi:hypothetical protein